MNIDLEFVSQTEGFIFINNRANPASNSDAIAVWKKEVSGLNLYVVQDRKDNGTIIVSPSEYDDCGRAVEFTGVFIEAGFATGTTTPPITQEPAAGQIRIYWSHYV